MIWLLKYGEFEKQRLQRFLLWIVPFLLVGCFFIYTTVESTVVEYRAKQFSEEVLADYYVLEQNILDSPQTIQLSLVGADLTDQEMSELQQRLLSYHLDRLSTTIVTYSSREDGSLDASVLAENSK